MFYNSDNQSSFKLKLLALLRYPKLSRKNKLLTLYNKIGGIKLVKKLVGAQLY